MKKYICEPCGYEYDPAIGDPDGGIAPGTAFEDIPDDWVCPICGLGKDVFVPAEDSLPIFDRHLIVVQNLYFISGRQTNQSLVLKRNQHPGQGWSRRIQIRSQLFPVHM